MKSKTLLSIMMRVLCSVLSRGVGHIRQLYPRDNWPDRDAKQVWRHFEERARSQVRHKKKLVNKKKNSSHPFLNPSSKTVISHVSFLHFILSLLLFYFFFAAVDKFCFLFYWVSISSTVNFLSFNFLWSLFSFFVY